MSSQVQVPRSVILYFLLISTLNLLIADDRCPITMQSSTWTARMITESFPSFMKTLWSASERQNPSLTSAWQSTSYQLFAPCFNLYSAFTKEKTYCFGSDSEKSTGCLRYTTSSSPNTEFRNALSKSKLSIGQQLWFASVIRSQKEARRATGA